ncbi:MAG TPA: dicarboxylate/amino acid:cation symporter [Planctomycetaceae bacterium]|nr:dicarboxylate/amino acid:cation symporter [Planctomycetaceae bacterium]
MKLELHWQILIGMILGAALGIGANIQLSTRTSVLTVADGLPQSIADKHDITSAIVMDSSNLIKVTWVKTDGSEETRIVDPTGKEPGAVLMLEDLKKKSPLAHELYSLAPSYAKIIGQWCKRIGSLFLRLLQMVSVPLIITSLASGVLGLGGASRFGKMFSTTLGYYMCTSFLAILTGLLITNIINPGLNSEIRLDLGVAQVEPKSITETLMEQVEAMIPANPFEAIASAKFLSVISFTIVFCIFALQVGGDVHKRFQQLAGDGFAVMMKLTTAIIKLAPYGVFLLMIYVTATQGAKVFSALGWYMLAVVVALGVHAFVTLPLVLWLLGKRNPFGFLQHMSPALLTAFSSASSNATLPITMSNIEERAGVSNRSSSFVLPLGATINMDGTALYEAVAVLFIGQLAMGDEFTFMHQVSVAVTALLASVGAAGIPHAGLVMMAIVLQAVNLPIEYQGIILAVDRVLDMMRTAVNVWSDSCGTALVDHLIDNPDAPEVANAA